REVVRQGQAAGCRVVAHIRPESPRRTRWAAQFSSLGAEVDVTEWAPDAIGATLARVRPTHVFALLGTTWARSRREVAEGRGDVNYESVDYRLTRMLIDGCRRLPTPPCFLYVSSMGFGSYVPHERYLGVRRRIEAELGRLSMPHVIVRPSFITGPDRDEFRPGERLGAAVADRALNVVGWLGGRKLRDRYQSLDNVALAAALLRLALDPHAQGRIVEADELRSA
ncbi:MAG: epimerase, partial [Myxococcota bacterium]